MIILGFDLSTTTIGYCALEVDKVNKTMKYIESGYIKPPKDGNIFNRLDSTRTFIIEVLNKIKPSYIAIEDYIMFMKGASGAKTIIPLAVFNRMVGLACFDYLKQPPFLYNVMTIRHGIKISKKPPQKEEIPALAEKILGITFPYKYKINKKTKIEEIATESYDMGDAFAVAIHCAKLFINDKPLQPELKNKKKSKK